FVFAKERSQAAIREALNNRRTAAYYRELVIGREEILRPFFEKCVTITETKRTEKSVTISMENKSDLVFHIKKTAHNPSLVYFRDKTLKPHTKYSFTIEFNDNIKGGDCNFEVTNFVIAPNKGLDYTIKL
ncbi:MAG: Sb-PDE family phosphodiesterase, partial [Fibrobacter sp.]|nr:Sb-PDE family phosphodiesterase [Fibrobacter sp.]